MDTNNIICPVCTLYLRPGITLKQHLNSHPKQKVIEALVRLSNANDESAITTKITDNPALPSPSTSTTSTATTSNIINQNNTNSPTWPPINHQPIPQFHGNHVFIYQQSLSSTTTPPQPNVLNVDPLSQPYVVPTVFNTQMMPYIYQQQQVILSSGACVPPPPPSIRALPFDMPTNLNEIPTNSVITEMTDDASSISNTANVATTKTISTQSGETVDEIVEKEEEDQDELEEKLEAEESEIVKSDPVQDNVDEVNDAELEEEEEDEECVPSPHSSVSSDWNLRVRNDLSKACQTPTIEPDITDVPAEEKAASNDYYFIDQTNTPNFSGVNYEGTPVPPPVYTNTPNLLQNSEQIDYIDMDGMQLPINEFTINHNIISQVENFENTTPDRSGIIMTIGNMMVEPQDDPLDIDDTNISHESTLVNIRADEKMPARGELSGQESMGSTSDITWNRLQYNNNNNNVFVEDNWTDDHSNLDLTPSRQTPNFLECDENDIPQVVGYTPAPRNFKCSTCGEAFVSVRDRKKHEDEKHRGIPPRKLVTNKKKVKKLVLKLKTPSSTSTSATNETNYNFTNKLKIETDDLVKPDLKKDADDIDKKQINRMKVVCSLCDHAFENNKLLKQHKVDVHNIAPDIRHKCNTCNEIFANEFKFTAHLRIHPLECKICGKLFYRRQNIQMHLKRHLGIKPYKCEICEKSFLTKQKYSEHKNTHTGEAPIKCSLCDESFRRHSNLVQHRNRRHFNMKRKVKDYICFCNEVFHSKKKLAWHQEIHEAKPKACTFCSEKFIHMSSLTRHMRRAHNERFLPTGHKQTQNVECPICKGVYLKSSLEAHIRNHSGQRPYACLICNKDFTTKWNLKLHKWTHASRVSKPFKCDQCKGAFIREPDYVAHMNAHKSIRPYTCNYCGAQFIRKYNCQRHVKEHENEKTYNCTLCGKSFHRSYYLKDHMRTHTGVRPYSCHICGKTSATKSNHNKHLQIHHAREPVSTEN